MELLDQFTVEVTAEDIAHGVRCDRLACPIALAAARVIGHSVLVSKLYVRSHSRSPDQEFVRCRHDSADFVSGFDAGLPVAPRTVTLTRVV